MAVNPMQRRARNSFLIGFLLALIIGALVVVLLVMKIRNLNDEFDALKALQKKVYVASSDIESGAEVSIDSFTMDTVQTTISSDQFITSEDFEYVDKETGDIIEKYDQKGNPIKKTMIVKTNVPSGSIITKDMLEELDSQTTDDLRLQEYNMIVLPTLLVNGDYIDVRLQLPTGEDYVVVTKKKVVYTTADTIWIKLTEEERLTLGNAIIEAYTIVGSKLYATTYTEPGRQESATATYPVNQAVMLLINNDPNVIESAKKALWERYNNQQQVDQRNDHLNKALENYYDQINDSVQEKLEEEITKIKERREDYITTLDGTGLIGTEN